ncbi:heavy-metal-associated domain-containing protein [Castellaniella sp.]|uniref:heavy-metal-associated domain-containing protein n=1 Tax=Castellaniella sp. TaxID=1955812 RepID=UPI002B003552|nr:heavy-metal-associated domain-containing protein [Castellaniella sp.]
MQKVVFNMEPFTCPSCVKKIEQTVGRIDGVRDIKVLFNSGRIRAEFDKLKTNVDALQDVIVRLGYPVLSRKMS